MSDQMVGLCWTAVSSRLGLISSTFALYQFLELELYQVLQEYPHARLNPSQVCMFRYIGNGPWFQHKITTTNKVAIIGSNEIRPRKIQGIIRYNTYFVRIRICKRFEIRSPRDFPGILKENH